MGGADGGPARGICACGRRFVVGRRVVFSGGGILVLFRPGNIPDTIRGYFLGEYDGWKRSGDIGVFELALSWGVEIYLGV